MTDLQRLEETVDLILHRVDRIMESVPTRAYITVKDIAVEHGWSISFINRNPWTMPNWGKSDYPGHERRWMKETAEQWFRVSPEKRQREWNRMSIRQRQKLTA